MAVSGIRSPVDVSLIGRSIGSSPYHRQILRFGSLRRLSTQLWGAGEIAACRGRVSAERACTAGPPGSGGASAGRLGDGRVLVTEGGSGVAHQTALLGAADAIRLHEYSHRPGGPKPIRGSPKKGVFASAKYVTGRSYGGHYDDRDTEPRDDRACYPAGTVVRGRRPRSDRGRSVPRSGLFPLRGTAALRHRRVSGAKTRPPEGGVKSRPRERRQDSTAWGRGTGGSPRAAMYAGLACNADVAPRRNPAAPDQPARSVRNW